MIIKKCPNCNKTYRARKSRQKYCSITCGNEARRVNISFKCETCGKECSRKASVFRKSKRSFCSRECADIARRGCDIIECPTCNKMFKQKKTKQIYCSLLCTPPIKQIDEYSPFLTHMGGAIKRMKKRNMEDQLDFDKVFLKELWERQEGKCAITGIRMMLEKDASSRRAREKKPHKASLDRIDSSKPYTKDNVQFICMCVNYMKNTFQNDEIVEFIESIKTG